MTTFAIDHSGSMGGLTERCLNDVRRRMKAGDRLFVFNMKIHEYPSVAGMTDATLPDMNSAEMDIVYGWMAANAPGDDLIVYTDGYMSGRFERTDGGKTTVMSCNTDFHAGTRYANMFPGTEIVRSENW